MEVIMKKLLVGLVLAGAMISQAGAMENKISMTSQLKFKAAQLACVAILMANGVAAQEMTGQGVGANAKMAPCTAIKVSDSSWLPWNWFSWDSLKQSQYCDCLLQYFSDNGGYDASSFMSKWEHFFNCNPVGCYLRLPVKCALTGIGANLAVFFCCGSRKNNRNQNNPAQNNNDDDDQDNDPGHFGAQDSDYDSDDEPGAAGN